MSREDALRAALSAALGVVAQRISPVGGGSISAAWQIATRDGLLFAKSGPASFAPMFAAERDGLEALAVCKELAVPDTLAMHDDADGAWLFLTWLNLRPPQSEDFARLGEALAALHSLSGPFFGWERDNFIGPTPQVNDSNDNWPRFFARCRLGPQLDLAAGNGYGAVLGPGQSVVALLDEVLEVEDLKPGLLHGDFWSGNCAVASDCRPALYDPAVHYGDPQCDLAMSKLFGGFAPEFYAAYAASRPPVGNVDERRDIYKLYHLLNHLNLFGGSYLNQCLTLMRRILRRYT